MDAYPKSDGDDPAFERCEETLPRFRSRMQVVRVSVSRHDRPVHADDARQVPTGLGGVIVRSFARSRLMSGGDSDQRGESSCKNSAMECPTHPDGHNPAERGEDG